MADITTTWTHNGSQVSEPTTRNPGESNADLIARHKAAVMARMGNGEQPDAGTNVETTWLSQGVSIAVTSPDPYFHYQHWLSAHWLDVYKKNSTNPID